MDKFTELFASFNGIMVILQRYTRGDILRIASELFEVESDKLSEMLIECPGSSGTRFSYGQLVDDLKKHSAYFRRLYHVLSSDKSKDTLFSILRYMLLPDPSFLQEARDESFKPNNEVNWIEISSIDDIVHYSEEIRELNYNEGVSVDIQGAPDELWMCQRMLSFLNSGLIFEIVLTDSLTLFARSYVYEDNTEWYSKPKRVASIAKTQTEWENVQLLKDNGLVPYLLYKNHDCRSTMVGRNNGGYTYLDSYVSGLEMEFLPTGSQEEKYSWIRKNAKDIDILIVNSVYVLNKKIVSIYKQENPSGVCYMPLDANSAWMDRVDFCASDFVTMMDSIDVIGTSGKAMQRFLNEKWPWCIEHFQNGYYHPWMNITEIPIEDKRNIILTVGRLGTEQKSTDVMLEAFAIISKDLPQWKLRLVGSVEELFKSYIQKYFKKHPELKSRVTFVGRIEDKEKLFEEYKSAKIFCLTSSFEGGTPNVVSEALHCGCAIVTTMFDAYDEGIHGGDCGMCAPVGDIKKVSAALLKMCKDDNMLKTMCHDAYIYAETKYSMEKVVSRIYEGIMEATCIK